MPRPRTSQHPSALSSAAWRDRQKALRRTPDGRVRCPECDASRLTEETLRVHRWIAHDVRSGS